MDRSDPFLTAFLRCRSALMRYVAGIVRCSDIAEDIVQDTFLRTYAVGAGAGSRSPAGLLYTTAHRLALNHIRHAKVETSAAQDGPAMASLMRETPDPEATAIAREKFEILSAVIETLPPQQRTVYILRKVYKLSYKEIAHEMDLSPATVKNYIAISVDRVLDDYRARVANGGAAAEAAIGEGGSDR